MYNDQIKQQFISLRAQGVSLSQCAGLLTIVRSTAVRWNKMYKTHIEEAKNYPAEMTFSGYGLDTAERLKTLAAAGKTIKERLLKNSSEESFHKDLAFFIKLTQIIGTEVKTEKNVKEFEQMMASSRVSENPYEPDPKYGHLNDYYVTRNSPDDELNFEGPYATIDIKGTELEKKLLEWCGDEEDISETVRIPLEVMKRYGIDPESAPKRPTPLDEFLLSEEN